MSDPFAIRMNFKRSYLEKMTSNPASQMRAAAYAVKYREQDEDLHSCILEQLDAVRILSIMQNAVLMNAVVEHQPPRKYNVLPRLSMRPLQTRGLHPIHRQHNTRSTHDSRSRCAKHKGWGYEYQSRAQSAAFAGSKICSTSQAR